MKLILILILLALSNEPKEFIICDLCDGNGFILKSTNHISCPECGNKTYCGPETNFKQISGWWKYE